MKRNVRTITEHRGRHPVSVSILEMWVVIAINMVWLVVSLIIQ
jgi:hypothetical protein